MRTIKGFFVIAAILALAGCAHLDGLLGGRPPIARISASPRVGQAPLLVRFNGTHSEDDGRTLEYAWDFGDGVAVPSSGTPFAEHEYTYSGTFDAQLTVIDEDGNTATDSVTIDVENKPPYVSFRMSSDSPVVGERIVFDASGAFDPDGEIVDFTWEFGDGDTMRGTRVSHVYEAAGVYTMRLTVEDNGGTTVSRTHVMTVHLGGSGGCSGGGGIPTCP